MPSGLFRSLIPWILYFSISGSQHIANEIAALAALIATVVFNFNSLQKKFILDLCSLIYFTFLFFILLLPIGSWLGQNAFLFSNAFLAIVMWVSIFIKQPFTMQYAREKVDKIFSTTPTFQHINYSISLAWALALSFMAVDSLLQTLNIINSNAIVDAIIVLLLIAAIWFTQWFPDWYQGFLFRKLSKEKEDISNNPYLQGNYAPIKNELLATNLPIEGELPKDLQGIYMRNGPNPEFHPISYTYPIDGDAMLHAIYINEGKVNYRNQFVETKGLVAERRAGRALYGGIKKPIPTDPKLIGKNGDPGPVKDGAFIHIIHHAKQYLAMYEGGSAYEVSAQLQTIGEWCPKGTNPPFTVNAHTRLDPNSGNLYAFTYSFQPPYLNYYVIDSNGNLTHNIPIEKANSSMMHDFILTENYVVFFDCPAIFDFNALTTGANLLRWKPELGTKIGVVDRKNNDIFWIETEPFFVFHFANGFEKNQHIIIDYVRHKKLSLGKDLSFKAPPFLYRTIINLNTKTVSHKQLDDHPVEFPRINDEITSRSNRYIYMPTKTTTAKGEFNALIKYDVENQNSLVHDFGKNAEIGEAVFVPKLSKSNEDDGYVALFVYNKNENKSDFVLLDAQTFTDKAIACVKLPQRVPHGLHGSWMPGQW